nr:hypothetical protein [uncultured Devosia sp.]
MATYFSTGAHAPGNPFPQTVQHELPLLVGGLIYHPLMSASVQVTILAVVDHTGSASVGDIIAELAGHCDPVGAIQVMVDLNILVIETGGVIDASSVVRRADPQPDPENQGGTPFQPTGGAGCDGLSVAVSEATVEQDPQVTPEQRGIVRLDAAVFSPNVTVAEADARRALSRDHELRRPGVYILASKSEVYVGTSNDVGLRVASGQQPIADVDTIIVITDENGNLDGDDAKVAERLLWSRIHHACERVLINGLPDGATTSAGRLAALEVMLSAACLALRDAGVMFLSGHARSIMAGPRQEPGRLASVRPFNQIPRGEIFELNFAGGLVALAARQADDRWLLLRGSDVKVGTAASANSSIRFLRALWEHTGLLELAHDGRSLTTKRDLVFASGSAVAQFCVGNKGRSLDSWKPIDPSGGYDPETPALILA